MVETPAIPAEQAAEVEVIEGTEGTTPPDETGAAEAAAATPPDETGAIIKPILKPKPKQTAQERIDEITRLRRDDQREKEYWKKIALSTAQREPLEPPVKKEEAVLPPAPVVAKPNLNDFESVEKYEEELLNWHDRNKQAEADVKNGRERDRQQKAEELNAERQFLERAADFEKDHPDFLDIVSAPVYSPTMKKTLFATENGVMTAYYLGLPENRPIAEKIKALPPHLQVYELGKIETQVLFLKLANKRTNAPDPINPVNSNSGETVDTSKMSDEEFYAYDERRRVSEYKKQKLKLGG